MHSASPFIQGYGSTNHINVLPRRFFLIFIWISGDCFLRPKHVHISYTSVKYSISFDIIIIYVFDNHYYCTACRLVHPAFFALCTKFFAWLCQNMLQIILCYVGRICYIKNDIYSLICFKAMKRKRIDVRNAIGSIHSAAWHDVHLRSGDHILGGKYYGSESVRLQNFLRGCELR